LAFSNVSLQRLPNYANSRAAHAKELGPTPANLKVVAEPKSVGSLDPYDMAVIPIRSKSLRHNASAEIAVGMGLATGVAEERQAE
jgi:hypothetical protein